MKELNKEEIKQINLRVLKCLADFCEQGISTTQIKEKLNENS